MKLLPMLWCSAAAICVASQVCSQTDSMAAMAGHGVAAVADGWRGGGPDYRVAFDRGGVELTPALGRQAAQSYPLRLRLESIRRGEHGLWQATADGALPRHDQGVVVYDRAGIAERYEILAEGVKQSFVFGEAPAGSGDLVVRVRLDTELTVVEASDRGLRLGAPGLGGVRIGEVIGIDAAGGRVLGSLRHDGNALEMVLPAQFVAEASYPMTLDPLIGADFPVSSGSDDMNPDVAYDASNDLYLVVWQRDFSAADVEIRAQRLSSSGALVGSLLVVMTGADVAALPTVANVNATDRFLVAWQQAPTLFGNWDIKACAVNADGTVSPAITVAGVAVDEIEPDVGGDATTSDDEAIVVWTQVGGGIRATEITLAAGTGIPVVGNTVSITPGPNDGVPAISKSGGSAGRYVIAWQRLGAFFGIRAAAVDRDLTILHPLLTVSTGADARSADVDGDGTDFLIAYQRSELAGGSSNFHDIYCRLVRWDTGTNTLVTVTPETPVENDVNDNEITPAVALFGPKYAIAWNDVDGFLASTIGTRELDPRTCGLCAPRGTIATTNPYHTDPKLASQLSGGGTSDEGLLVFGTAQSSPPFTGSIVGQRWEAIGAGGAITSLGGGCGLGGTAGVSGALAVGNPTFQFTLTGASPAAIGTAFVVGAVGPGFSCGTCTLTNPAFVVGLPISGGASALPISVPCDASLVGGSIEGQWWVVVPGGPTPCVLGPSVSVSDRLQMTVGL